MSDLGADDDCDADDDSKDGVDGAATGSVHTQPRAEFFNRFRNTTARYRGSADDNPPSRVSTVPGAADRHRCTVRSAIAAPSVFSVGGGGGATGRDQGPCDFSTDNSRLGVLTAAAAAER